MTTAQFTERLAELEAALVDGPWIRLDSTSSDNEFSRTSLATIVRLAQIMYLKNPLITRAVNIKTDYTFGRGINFSAKDETINEVIQTFKNDQQNATELTDHVAQLEKDHTLQVDGNIFFTLFVHPLTGRVRVSTIPIEEITEVLTDPDNRRNPWYYKREWSQENFNYETGTLEITNNTRYYRDWQYRGVSRATIAGNEVDQEAVIYHVKVGGLDGWKFGLSELYSSIDWARAYKDFLADFATIMKALARFAWRQKTKGGARGLALGKAALAANVATGLAGNTNPPPVAGATLLQDDTISGEALTPIRTANATTSPDAGRRLMLMVAAGMGLPETFFGDVSVGTLATATSLDRPTELMLGNRQKLWQGVYKRLLDFVIYNAVVAPQGPLRSLARTTKNEYGESIVTFADAVDTAIDVDFPSLIERDTQSYISAIISAATLDGKQPSIITDKKMLAKMLLVALGEDDVDRIVEDLYADIETDELDDPDTPPVDNNPLADVQGAIEALREAVRGLNDSINQPVRTHYTSTTANGSGSS